MNETAPEEPGSQQASPAPSPANLIELVGTANRNCDFRLDSECSGGSLMSEETGIVLFRRDVASVPRLSVCVSITLALPHADNG